MTARLTPAAFIITNQAGHSVILRDHSNAGARNRGATVLGATFSTVSCRRMPAADHVFAKALALFPGSTNHVLQSPSADASGMSIDGHVDFEWPGGKRIARWLVWSSTVRINLDDEIAWRDYRARTRQGQRK